MVVMLAKLPLICLGFEMRTVGSFNAVPRDVKLLPNSHLYLQ